MYFIAAPNAPLALAFAVNLGYMVLWVNNNYEGQGRFCEDLGFVMACLLA